MNLAIVLGMILWSAVSNNESKDQKPPLNEVRDLYQKAPVDKRSCFELLELLKPVEVADSRLYGYKGANLMISAQYVFSPFGKLSRFNEGKQMLESAVSAETGDVELRYLRLSIQKNAPAILGYNQSIEADRLFLKQALPNISDPRLRQQIVEQIY